VAFKVDLKFFRLILKVGWVYFLIVFEKISIRDMSNPIRHIIDDERLESLRRMGLIDEVELRNVKIRQEYRELLRKYGSARAKEMLSERYFLSIKSIESILYDKRFKKSKIRLI